MKESWKAAEAVLALLKNSDEKDAGIFSALRGGSALLECLGRP